MSAESKGRRSPTATGASLRSILLSLSRGTPVPYEHLSRPSLSPCQVRPTLSLHCAKFVLLRPRPPPLRPFGHLQAKSAFPLPRRASLMTPDDISPAENLISTPMNADARAEPNKSSSVLLRALLNGGFVTTEVQIGAQSAKVVFSPLFVLLFLHLRLQLQPDLWSDFPQGSRRRRRRRRRRRK